MHTGHNDIVLRARASPPSTTTAPAGALTICNRACAHRPHVCWQRSTLTCARFMFGACGAVRLCTIYNSYKCGRLCVCVCVRAIWMKLASSHKYITLYGNRPTHPEISRAHTFKPIRETRTNLCTVCVCGWCAAEAATTV